MQILLKHNTLYFILEYKRLSTVVGNNALRSAPRRAKSRVIDLGGRWQKMGLGDFMETGPK